MRQREAKLERLVAMGMHAYPNDFRVSHSTAEAYDFFLAPNHLESFSPLAPGEQAPENARGRHLEAPAMSLAGRVVAINVKGKLAFVRIADRGATDLPGRRACENAMRAEAGMEEREATATTFQLFFSRAADPVRFDALFKSDGEEPPLLDVGDVVGANGRPFRTNTGEPSLRLGTGEAGGPALRILTKSLRPLPDKWTGLGDKETRYRQRYVDLLVHDEVRATFVKRARIISQIRRFFESRGYLEVETPMMHPLVGGAAARPFETWHNALGVPLFLRIAPELYLKRLVVGGLDRVFEINRNFRNEGLSQQHNPEFTMLEFYQAFATYEDLMELVETMFAELAVAICGTTEVPYGEDADGNPRIISLAAPFARVSVWQGIERWSGLQGDAIHDADALRAELAGLGHEPSADWPVGKLQMELFELVAEPRLIQPTFVTQFPVEVSPLSRRNDAEPRLTDRFEVYMGGFEVGNAFSELNDPVDQFERFADQVRNKQGGDGEAMDMDVDYIRALEVGLPPTAGCGIGIDRLVMVLTNTPSIREVILFPLLRPERFGLAAAAGDDAEAHPDADT
ncbi:MAG: lysine--tRNA ligase [Deltaproteobacteria bacterium]|nr:lysine--tRNA ligase [Deltaproteobacteria bacterium]